MKASGKQLLVLLQVISTIAFVKSAPLPMESSSKQLKEVRHGSKKNPNIRIVEPKDFRRTVQELTGESPASRGRRRQQQSETRSQLMPPPSYAYQSHPYAAQHQNAVDVRHAAPSSSRNELVWDPAQFDLSNQSMEQRNGIDAMNAFFEDSYGRSSLPEDALSEERYRASVLRQDSEGKFGNHTPYGFKRNGGQ
jgi:hypothetical protein